MKKNFKAWAKATATRAVKTVAETAVSLISVSALMSEVDWAVVGSASLLSGIICILTCIAGLPEVPDED